MSKRKLTIGLLQREAKEFALTESTHLEPSLYGITDGKRVGTYFERKFQQVLQARYATPLGNAAKGIDLPDLNVDLKVTSIRQPQSSCPFRSARQKIFGLGYSLLVFVYDKQDDARKRVATLNVVHTLFVDAQHTADYQTTRELRRMLDHGANQEEIVAFFRDRYLPVDEIEAGQLADEVLQSPPQQGYLTISNALQWRLQYGRAIASASQVDGVVKIL